MRADVYDSNKTTDFLLLPEGSDGDFSEVPSEKMAEFGEPYFVGTADLENESAIGLDSLDKIKQSLREKGYHIENFDVKFNESIY